MDLIVRLNRTHYLCINIYLDIDCHNVAEPNIRSGIWTQNPISSLAAELKSVSRTLLPDGADESRSSR